LLLAFMFATALLSTSISNTSTALIMMPMALAGARRGRGLGRAQGRAVGRAADGIAFAASIGGLGTIIGSPTNAIAVGLLEQTIGIRISFVQWMLYGMPLVLLGVPLAALIIAKGAARRRGHVRCRRRARRDRHPARVDHAGKRLVPLFALAFVLWVTQPLTEPLLPDGALTDGTIAVFVGLLLFVVPDGTGRPMLTWPEANRAPWDVIMMFGGGLALARG
jgi:sodium-dependent dicarboxylate transporter 2/3/5